MNMEDCSFFVPNNVQIRSSPPMLYSRQNKREALTEGGTGKTMKKEIKVWIDDVRPKPADYGIALHSVNDVIAYLDSIKDSSASVLLDLDHDAGDYSCEGGDYIRILDWIEATGFALDNPEARLAFRIHSANPVGRANLQRVIEKNGWPLML